MAQEAPAQRPSEQELFGDPPAGSAPAPAPETPRAEPPSPVPPAAESAPAEAGGAEGEGAHLPPAADVRDQAILGAPEAAPRLSAETAPEDPLRIGGMIYLRSQSLALEDQAPADWSFSAPILTDAYFDARPNPRVRGFVLGRLLFDPTLGDAGDLSAGLGAADASGGLQGSAPLSSLVGRRTRGPTVALDQLWLRFDIAERVFVTAGRQHVRWGTARFWMPTDFLHIRRRNPLDVFDARIGTTMLKLHVPWEAQGWNFYAYAVVEGAGATPSVGDVAGAARAEIVLGTAEIGLGALVQQDRKPKLAADLSFGIWELDFYGEAALRHAGEIDRVVAVPDATVPPVDPLPWESADEFLFRQVVEFAEARFSRERASGWRPQVSGGFTYQRRYHDNDVWTFGGEYFWNALGYEDAPAYLGLVLPRRRPLAEPASFFYLGRQYAALFLAFPAPFDLDLHSFTLSTIGNLSDGSFISRFDYAFTLLTHMRFEAFVSLRYGNEEGEFRFGLSGLPGVGDRAPAILDLGLALRVEI